ncbi:MAG: nitroreductase family protein, partial [Ruminiclostridium sp.]|nr:nitroreductase family protein [Ruminiclostridium sp.]
MRRFTDTPITDEALRTILEAGMSGPSCVNARDWSFLATRDRDILGKMADANGRPAEPLHKSTLGILVLGDLERAFQPAKEYWIIDGAITAENMILAAWGLGIGSVWLGTWPQTERVEKLRESFSRPETVVPP